MPYQKVSQPEDTLVYGSPGELIILLIIKLEKLQKNHASGKKISEKTAITNVWMILKLLKRHMMPVSVNLFTNKLIKMGIAAVRLSMQKEVILQSVVPAQIRKN